MSEQTYYNYRDNLHGCYWVNGIPNDEQAKLFIPQDVASQGIYKCHRDLGLDVLHALLETLLANVRAYKSEGEK